MSDDLVKRLREFICPSAEAEMMNEAADRIEELETEVSRLKGLLEEKGVNVCI